MFRKQLKRLPILCGVMALAFTASSVQALEEREFHNADKSKSFKGTVIGYDAQKKKVTIRSSRGGVSHVKLSAFCEEDQKYILDNANALAASKSLEFSFKEVTGGGSKKTGFDTGYDISLYNRGTSEIKDIEFKYTIYYRVGSVKKGVKTVAKEHSGDLSLDSLYGTLRYTLSTSKVKLVREIVKGKAGGG